MSSTNSNDNNNIHHHQQQPKGDESSFQNGNEEEKELFLKTRIEIENKWKKILSDEKLDSLKKVELQSLRKKCEDEMKRQKSAE